MNHDEHFLYVNQIKFIMEKGLNIVCFLTQNEQYQIASV